METKELPHFLRVTRALTLVSTIVLPAAAVNACGGSVDTESCAPEACPHPVAGGVEAYDGGGGVRAYDVGDASLPVVGTLPYTDASVDQRVVGTLPYTDAAPDVVSGGIVPYDSGND